MPRDTQKINPLVLVAAKQRVGQDDTDLIALPLLIHFDTAKRGQCSAIGCNHMTTHLIIATYIASRTRSKRFHDIATRAYNQLRRAAARPGDLLSLTTTEYQALRDAFAWYLRALPMVEVGVLNMACVTAEKMMGA